MVAHYGKRQRDRRLSSHELSTLMDNRSVQGFVESDSPLELSFNQLCADNWVLVEHRLYLLRQSSQYPRSWGSFNRANNHNPCGSNFALFPSSYASTLA
jgi:hypothetical protein